MGFFGAAIDATFAGNANSEGTRRLVVFGDRDWGFGDGLDVDSAGPDRHDAVDAGHAADLRSFVSTDLDRFGS